MNETHPDLVGWLLLAGFVVIVILAIWALFQIVKYWDTFKLIASWAFAFWICIGIVDFINRNDPQIYITFSQWLIVGLIVFVLALAAFFVVILIFRGAEKIGDAISEAEYEKREMEREAAERKARRKFVKPWPVYNGEIVEEPGIKGRLESWENQVDPELRERARSFWYWRVKRGAVGLKVTRRYCNVCQKETPHYVYSFGSSQCAWH